MELCATRIYGSYDQFGESPRTYNGQVNPIILHDYPNKGEELFIYFGDIPEEILTAHTMANARNHLLLNALIGAAQYPDLPKAVLDEAARPGYQPDVSRFSWYVTLLLKKTVELTGSPEQHHEQFYPQIEEFDSYSAQQFDLVTTYLTTVLSTRIFTTLFVNDRVFFSIPGQEMLYLPKSTMTARPSLRRPEDAVNAQEVENLLARVAAVPKSRHKWLATFKHWYINVLREDDQWKKFQWSFLALEILTNKLAGEFYAEVVGAINFKNLEMDLPLADIVWDESRLPLRAKFAIVAIMLCQSTANEDLKMFVGFKKFRDKISHGEIVHEDDLPLTITEFVSRYLTSAVKRLYATRTDIANTDTSQNQPD